MKLNKGKVDNINKKILSGALALTLTFTTLTGCAKSFKYSKVIENNKLSTSVTGKISANKLRLIELNIYGEKELRLVTTTKNNDTTEYWDVFENYKVIELRNSSNVFEKDENIKIENEQKYKDYLIRYGYKGNYFKMREIKESFNITKKLYENNSNKQLVKK